MTLVRLLLAMTVAFVPFSGDTVSVMYAGSLVRVMEGPLAASLHARTGLRFSGEAKGSKAIAQLIRAGLRTPDIFVSADPKLIDGIAPYIIFGSARMVVAYSQKSPQHALFEQAADGKRSILDVLADPSVRVGRTDPQLDPKGERTLKALALLGRHYYDSALAKRVEQKSEMFPEEDLAVRVESGEVDAGFFYSTEIPGRGLRTVELPADANLSSEITYAIAELPDAPHPRAAAAFVDFILNGDGKRILEQAGVQFFAHPRRISP
jgi:molybdate/tungstate transport system substrate-binding protein